MKKYEHKAICEYCKKQEFDGCWVKYRDGGKVWIYVCYRCIKNVC